jgi:MarR family transcriptional regulator, transcriptional regulator for hemolysin
MAGIRDIWLFANNIIRSSRQIINEELRPLNLSSAEGNILLHLLTQNDESPQEVIVEQLDVSKPAVSRALESLAQKGYVARHKDPVDRRASRIRLTDKARQIAPQIEQIYNGVFAIAAQGISDKEISDFIDLFGRVSQSFSRACTERRRQGRKEWS